MVIVLLWVAQNVNFFIQTSTSRQIVQRIGLVVGGALNLTLAWLSLGYGWSGFGIHVTLLLLTLHAADSTYNYSQRTRSELYTPWLLLQLLLLVSAGVAFSIHQLGISHHTIALAVVLTSTLVAGWAGRRIETARRLMTQPGEPVFDESKLPTVSLLIPARNEGRALNDTLSAAVGSDYPKLEVLVLDDCSQDRTPDIIRSFAHAGVRFIEGRTVPPNWLGRNYALEQLQEVANGEVLIVCDVDIHLSEASISKTIDAMLASNASVVSIHPSSGNRLTLNSLMRPMRAFWKLLFQSNPIHGQYFAIKKSDLRDVGGFAAFSEDYYFEYALSRSIQNRISFHSGRVFGITIRKYFRSHLSNQLRGMYPFVYQHIVRGWFVIMGVFIVLVAPIMLMASEWLWLALVVIALWIVVYGRFAVLEQPVAPALLTALLFPLRIVLEFLYFIASIALYSFNRVTWKNRNVCLPVVKR